VADAEVHARRISEVGSRSDYNNTGVSGRKVSLARMAGIMDDGDTARRNSLIQQRLHQGQVLISASVDEHHDAK
jgi:hypothetical protein